MGMVGIGWGLDKDMDFMIFLDVSELDIGIKLDWNG